MQCNVNERKTKFKCDAIRCNVNCHPQKDGSFLRINQPFSKQIKIKTTACISKTIQALAQHNFIFLEVEGLPKLWKILSVLGFFSIVKSVSTFRLKMRAWVRTSIFRTPKMTLLHQRNKIQDFLLQQLNIYFIPLPIFFQLFLREMDTF